MKVGIIGLPNVGKSSLLNLLTSANAEVAPYPFTTINPNYGMVEVPDSKLKALAELLHPEKVSPAMLEFVDVAGLVKNAHKGEGLGNQFLSHIRNVDCILHLLRGFGTEEIPFIYPDINPKRDKELVEAELALSDLEIIEKRLKKEKSPEYKFLNKIHDFIAKGERPKSLSDEEKRILKGMGILSYKPCLAVLNCPADRAWDEPVPDGWYKLSIKLEEEIKHFSPEEKRLFREELNLEPEGAEGLVERVFSLLGLIRFYTIKGKEIRAWKIPKGTEIIEAAGKIHTDLKKGFIKAEVIDVDELLRLGGYKEAQEEGKVLTCGKDHIVKDGEVILIKFKA